jgi:hypothetical protein
MDHRHEPRRRFTGPIVETDCCDRFPIDLPDAVHRELAARIVLIAHGMDQGRADGVWGACVAISAIVATAIIVGMCGVRIGVFAS